jgi:thioredoxin reductase
MDVDVVIVGGGPAGLSAALVLARACRTVRLIDAGHPRNSVTGAVHGFLTRDGIAPAELRRLGRADLAPFPNVAIDDDTVVRAGRHPDGGFRVETAAGATWRSRKLVLATGVVDNLPAVPGFDEFYGTGIFHCPFCDGWPVRDQRLAVYGRGARGAGLALELLGWSKDVVVCSDGPCGLGADDRETLTRNGITVIEHPVEAFRGDDGRLQAVAFHGREPLACAAVFFSLGQHQASPVVQALGCRIGDKGTVDTARHESTNVPGVFVVGDASRNLQWVALAAAEGAEAAFAIATALIAEERR